MLVQRRESLVLLTESAVAVALSVLLGSLRLLTLPNGGSIALATLPLLALALSRGVRVGVLAGACAGIAQALSGGTIVHPVQLGLDYLLAYAALGLAGLAAGRASSRAHVTAAIALAMSLHLAAMVASGVVFFSTVAGGAALTYSLAYNAATVVPEALLSIWLVPPLLRAVGRANPADAWRRGLLDAPRIHARAVRRYRPIDAAAPIDTSSVPTDTHAPPTDTQPLRRPAPRASFVRPSPFAVRDRLGGAS